jgi:hypothetical protein
MFRKRHERQRNSKSDQKKQKKEKKWRNAIPFFPHILAPESIHGPSIGSLAAHIAKLESISVVSSGTQNIIILS